MAISDWLRELEDNLFRTDDGESIFKVYYGDPIANAAGSLHEWGARHVAEPIRGALGRPTAGSQLADEQMRQFSAMRNQGEGMFYDRLSPGPSAAGRDTGGMQLENQDVSLLARANRQAQLQENQQGPDSFDMQAILDEYKAKVAGSYDAQIGALKGLEPIYREGAQEAQENIGDFFGYAADVAKGGIAPTEEAYAGAQENVNTIYDDLGNRLESTPQRLTDIAAQAAGPGNADRVAGAVATTIAPFVAAGESGRASALSNLTQSGQAASTYLNQLASAAPAEGALHQSNVEQALNQQLQLIAMKAAEIEGSKQRALAEIAADVAGESSERMADAALAQALGLELPPGVDPGDYLTNRNKMLDYQSKVNELAGGDAESPLPNLSKATSYLDQFQDKSNDYIGTFQKLIDQIDANYRTNPGFDTASGEAMQPQALQALAMDAVDQWIPAGGPEREIMKNAVRIYYSG